MYLHNKQICFSTGFTGWSLLCTHTKTKKWNKSTFWKTIQVPVFACYLFYADHKSEGSLFFVVCFPSPLYILKLFFFLCIIAIYLTMFLIYVLDMFLISIFVFIFVFQQNNVVATTTLTTSRVGSRWQIFGRRSPVLHWHNFVDA